MLSVPHLIIIFLVALIVFGPEKLPELARTFGKAMTEFKRATGDLRAGFEEHMRELEHETSIREAQKKPAEPEKPGKKDAPSATAETNSAAAVTHPAEPAGVTAQISETVSEKAANGDV